MSGMLSSPDKPNNPEKIIPFAPGPAQEDEELDVRIKIFLCTTNQAHDRERVLWSPDISV